MRTSLIDCITLTQTQREHLVLIQVEAAHKAFSSDITLDQPAVSQVMLMVDADNDAVGGLGLRQGFTDRDECSHGGLGEELGLTWPLSP